nr:hypothetical protein [Tanacetum cinerariifolium]
MLMFADTVGAVVNEVYMPLLFGDLIDSFSDNENNNDVVNAKVSLKFVYMPDVAGVAAFLRRRNTGEVAGRMSGDTSPYKMLKGRRQGLQNPIVDNNVELNEEVNDQEDQVNIGDGKSNVESVKAYTTAGKAGLGNVKPVSFASMLKEIKQTKTVHLSELHYNEIVTGGDVSITLASVKEIGSYGKGPLKLTTARHVPIILNIWTPNARLKKDEITTVPVWVKLYNVPVVVYSKIGLRLITTKLGLPIMLDAYTSNMCVNSRGRNTYARAPIEVSSEKAFVGSFVVVIPYPKGSGHSMKPLKWNMSGSPLDMIHVRFFYHNDDRCPEKVKIVEPTMTTDDGFIETNRKHRKGKQPFRPKHIDGVRLTKLKPNYYYRAISKPASEN